MPILGPKFTGDWANTELATIQSRAVKKGVFIIRNVSRVCLLFSINQEE